MFSSSLDSSSTFYCRQLSISFLELSSRVFPGLLSDHHRTQFFDSTLHPIIEISRVYLTIPLNILLVALINSYIPLFSIVAELKTPKRIVSLSLIVNTCAGSPFGIQSPLSLYVLQHSMCRGH